MNLRARLHDRRQLRCAHDHSMSVVSGGIERVVCESCGHVSVRVPAETEPDLAPETEPGDLDDRSERGQHRKLETQDRE
jgi:hypothetical protein